MTSKMFNFPFQNLNNLELKSCYEPNIFSQNNTDNTTSQLYIYNKYNYREPSNIKSSDTHNKLSILALNIRSLNGNFHKIKTLLSELNFDPAVILVSETWITDKNPFVYSLKNYSFINQPGVGKVGGAGIFIKDNINYTKIDDFNLNLKNCEDIWIKLIISSNESLIISSIYRHPSYDIQKFQELMLDKIETLNNLNKIFVLGGDVNINTLSNSKITINYKNSILGQGTLQLVKSPTRVKGTAITLLDHLYTNIPEDQTQTDTLIFPISDHMPILTFLNPFKLNKQSFKRKRFRDLKNIDYIKFNKDLEQKLIEIPFENTNLTTNKLWDLFERTLKSTLDKHAPQKFQSRKQFKKSLSPWITADILHSIKTKRKLYKKALKKPSNSNWTEFRKHRNKLTHKIKQTKQVYYQSEITKVKSNPKKLWRTLNNIINVKKNINTIKEIKLQNETNNSIIKDPKKVGNKFNHFFTTIGSKLSRQITPPANHQNYTKSTQCTISNSFFLREMTISDVLKYISQLNPKKANKSDCIPTIIIKNCALTLAPFLTKIYNRCIKDGTFPDTLKSAEVHPIFKKGDKSLMTNYRPISILSAFSKIFERHIHTELTKFITKFNILHPFQFGFRTNSSTEMALTQIIEEISENMQNGKITCSVFLDLAKAFDTVDHQTLITKLYNYGVRGLPAKLIENYLKNRTQITLINNIKSNKEYITCGVPQGSILGPLLFIIYINDIIKSSNFKVNLFADDACLVYSCNDAKNLENNVNLELTKINTWRKLNKLSVNFSKSNYIIFTNKKNKHNYTIKMDKNTLARTEDIKYLGVIIDHKLKWKKHVNHITKKTAKVSYILSKIRHFVDISTLKTLYYSLLHPHLNYCLTAWGAAPNSTLKPLIVFQKKVLRIMTFSKFDHPSTDLFLKLDILPLGQLYNLNVSILMYKTHHNLITGRYKLTPVDNIHTYNTRFSKNKNYYHSHNKTNLGLSTFTAQGVKFWSKLPIETKQLPLHLYKKKLKQYLINSLKEEIT